MPNLLLSILFSLLCFVACQKTKLRVAFAYNTYITDMNWIWRVNQGRMYMASQLLDLYPGLSVQTYYLEGVEEYAYPPNCPSIFDTWAQSKMDLIFGASYGFQYCLSYLAAKYPDTIWFSLLGDMNLTLPNWGIGVGNIHHTIFLAGMIAGRETKTGKVGVCMPIRIPQCYGHLAAFAQGVAYVNASVKVIAAWIDTWTIPQREVFTVQRLVANNADIIWHRTGASEGVNEAVSLGVRGIGFNSDRTMLSGETVLISPYYNWGPLFLEVARLVVDGNYTKALPVDLFPGLEIGAAGLTDPSYLVSKATVREMLDMKASFSNGTNNTFCGPMLTNTGKIVGKAGSCLTLQEIRNLWWEPWNVVDVGHYALPNEVCRPGEQSHWDGKNEKYYCTACPAGTYSQVNSNMTYEEYVCLSCPPNTYSARNASVCSACPSGYDVTAQQDGCVAVPMATGVLVGIIVGAVAGAVFLVAGVYAGRQVWKATADLRRLRKQFSNNNVAQECAEAIAVFNLESVAWLRTCPNPNKIQLAFLQILEMLTIVKPYIPDHVLSSFTQRQPEGEGGEPPGPGDGAKAAERAEEGYDSDSGSGAMRPHVRNPAAARRQPSGSEENGPRSPNSNRARNSLLHADQRLAASNGDWIRKRCTYMMVTVLFALPAGGAQEDEEDDKYVHLSGQVLGEVIAIGKSFGATIDHVTCDRVALHWGLVCSVAEGALKSTQAAMEMGKVRNHLPFPARSLLRFSVSVSQGICSVATISAAGHSFFVVDGSMPRQLNRLAANGLPGKCQCEVLISDSVHGQVQYVVECMPRCLLGKMLFWQPLRQRAGDAHVDEWMYELHQMETGQGDKWSNRILLNVFQSASQAHDLDKLRTEVTQLRDRFKDQMSPQDEASLELLLAEGGLSST